MSNIYTVKCPPDYDDGLLYHFTNAEALFKILESMTLKLSSMSSVDDLNEKCICCRDDGWGINGINIEKYVELHCKTLSFSRNYYEGEERPSNVQSAINLPRMWAEYADKNNGACIIISERRFLEENQVILKNSFSDISDVEYHSMLYDGSIVANDNPEQFVKEHYKHILFKKHSDWQGQHERRLFCLGSDIKYLSIEKSLCGICIGANFGKNSESMDRLISTLINSGNRCYNKLFNIEFWIQGNLNGRCHKSQYGRIIRDKIEKHISLLEKQILEAKNCLPQKYQI